MSMFNFVSRSVEKAAVHSVVNQIAKELPPAVIEAGRGKVSVNKVTRLLERAYDALRTLRDQRSLGFVGRAVVANAFKWELKERGYHSDFVDMATEGLIVALSKDRK